MDSNQIKKESDENNSGFIYKSVIFFVLLPFYCIIFSLPILVFGIITNTIHSESLSGSMLLVIFVFAPISSFVTASDSDNWVTNDSDNSSHSKNNFLISFVNIMLLLAAFLFIFSQINRYLVDNSTLSELGVNVISAIVTIIIIIAFVVVVSRLSNDKDEGAIEQLNILDNEENIEQLEDVNEDEII